ncbi:MAG: hypothetical protein GXO47_09390 [Chlorobi bacterium]|nr:hypothetical protein [Chlorobiota bacterium]
MPANKRKEKLRTAYEEIADILEMQKAEGEKNIYISKETNKRFKLTVYGFEPENNYNKRLEIFKLEKQLAVLKKQNDELSEINETLIKRKEGLKKQLEKCYEYSGGLKKKKGFINKLLKEVLDKNVSLEKKYTKLRKQNENITKQMDNLKETKANLLKQFEDVVEKGRQQKRQIRELQEALTAKKRDS